MGLSQKEQSVLDDLERSFYNEKVDVYQMDAQPVGISVKAIVILIICLFVGMLAAIAGIATKLILVGLLGFAIMLFGFWFAFYRKRL